MIVVLDVVPFPLAISAYPIPGVSAPLSKFLLFSTFCLYFLSGIAGGALSESESGGGGGGGPFRKTDGDGQGEPCGDVFGEHCGETLGEANGELRGEALGEFLGELRGDTPGVFLGDPNGDDLVTIRVGEVGVFICDI